MGPVEMFAKIKYGVAECGRQLRMRLKGLCILPCFKRLGALDCHSFCMLSFGLFIIQDVSLLVLRLTIPRFQFEALTCGCPAGSLQLLEAGF